MKKRANLIAAGFFLLAVLCIFILPPGNRARVQRGFLSLISPLLKSGASVDSKVKSYSGSVKKIGDLEVENAKLRTDNDRMRAENQALRSVEGENLKLKKALGYQEQSPFMLMPARVIGRPVSNWWHTIEVDKGADDGIELAMPVLTPDGLVGKVAQVSAHAATVLLITDEKCGVAGSADGTAHVGIVHVETRGDRTASNLQPRMVLKFVNKNASLQPDTRIITSGADQVYPAGVSIGRVVEWKGGVLAGQAVLEPAVDLATVADVFIITGLKASAKTR